MGAAAALGCVMSSTAVVAIFIPIVARVAQRSGVGASRLLLPMSYGALISGMLTLIATAPNIVVSEELKRSGLEEFGFFGFTPIGVGVLAVAMVYMLLVGRRLLPSAEPAEEEQGRSFSDLFLEFHAGHDAGLQFVTYRIPAGSPVDGKPIGHESLARLRDTRILGIQRPHRRGDERITAPSGDTELRSQDLLLVLGGRTECDRLVGELGFERTPVSARDQQRWEWEQGMATVMVHPESRLVGKTVRELEFRKRFDLHVLGMRRAAKPVEGFADERLQPADSLLLLGPWSRLDRLGDHKHDFVPTELPRERSEVVESYRKAPLALAILGVMVALTVLNVVPLLAAVLLAVLAAIVTRCVTLEDAYRAIPWSSIVLVAGMLPLADALDKAGGTTLIVDGMMAACGDTGPRVMLSVIFFITAAIGLVFSNTASAVLMAPIAIVAGEALGVSPYPFAVAVVIAASAAFSTPVSTPVVTLVVEPGRYRFMDFVRVGLPLLVLTWLATLIITPLVFPFE